MKLIGGLPKSWSFFEHLLLDMPNDMWTVYIGSRKGEPVSGLLLLYYNGTVEYFTPVIKPEYRNTQALALVIYEAMEDAISNKQCNNWNWGGTCLTIEVYMTLRRNVKQLITYTTITRNYLMMG